MKYTSVILMLVIALSMSVKTNNQLKMQLQSQMEQLKKTSWGQVAASFVELQMEVGSPVGDLVQAFMDFYRDMGFKQDINTQDYNVQLAEHNEWEAAIRDRIASAQNDIAATTARLENVLRPLKAQLEDAIARDSQLVVDTVAAMDLSTRERAESHAANVAWVEEAGVAIDTIGECVALLQGLNGSTPSLVQVTKVQRSFKKLGEQLKNTKFSSVIKALLKLADFADPAMLARLTGKFQEVRDELAQGIVNTQQLEADELAAYNEFMGVSQDTVDQANQRIVENTAALVQCVQDIADSEAFRAQREADLVVAEADLVFELARWDAVQTTFDTLFAEMTNEMVAVEQVLDLLASLNVSEETFDRLNQ